VFSNCFEFAKGKSSPYPHGVERGVPTHVDIVNFSPLQTQVILYSYGVFGRSSTHLDIERLEFLSEK